MRSSYLLIFVLVHICVLPLYSQVCVMDSSELSVFEHTIGQFKLEKQTSSNFPIKDFESESIYFSVSSNIKDWQKLIYRYNTLPVINHEDNIAVSKHNNELPQHHIVIIDSFSSIECLNIETKPEILSLIILCDSISEPIRQLIQLADNVLYCSENTFLSRDIAIQYIFNAISLTNKLQKYDKELRLRYMPAEVFGVNSKVLKRQVDSVVLNAINAKCFPGCRVLLAHKGVVIFNESYGYHTYDRRIKVQQHDVFDLASVTKISGPLPLLMKAYDERRIGLDDPFSDYWKDWQNSIFHRSNKSKVSFREILAHQAGLIPYINYWPLTMKNGQFNEKYYRVNPSERFSLKIDQHLYLSNDFKKKVYKAIRLSLLRDEKKYKYSGLSFMIFPELISSLYERDYEELLYKEFFSPLGASSLVYNPIGKIDEHRILPTEDEQHFRKQQLKGIVHDEAAAILGGVSGNAGLFSSADDLAKLMQMYLQKGEYAGKRYISSETFDEFTRVQFPENENRRGLGFDKPLFGNDTLLIEKSYPAPAVSSSSFGHSGYTGTFVWVDPEYDLVYIFLSNRVYPTRDNPLIYRMNVRPSIQQIFYNALIKK